MAGRRGAVVEDEFHNKLKKLNVQAGKKDKILLACVQRICDLLKKLSGAAQFVLKLCFNVKLVWDSVYPLYLSTIRS